jgi:hypothetical protein
MGWNLTNKSDEELKSVLDRPGMIADQVVVVEQELIRRGLLQLNESSRTLERLTKRLVVLTVVLAVLTATLAVPMLADLVSWLVKR